MNSEMWLGLIPIVTPLLLFLVKLGVPKLPKAVIPILAPILGAALDLIAYWAGVSQGNPLLGAVLGAAGVGLREIVDQLKKLNQPAE